MRLSKEYLDYFPWAQSFEESFKEKYKYDIRPHLENILHRKTCKEAIDYWQHAGDFEMLSIDGGRHIRPEAYFVPNMSWGGDDSGSRTPNYYSVYSDLRAKQAGSTAFLYIKKGAMCEMFAATNFGATLTDLREIAAWQIMQGITFIVPHVYHHRFTGKLKYIAPPNLSYHSYLPWAMKEFNDYLAECVYYTSSGELNAPVAVLDITEDIWVGKTGSSTLFNITFKLEDTKEKADIEIYVRNTLANALEFYRAPSGLLGNAFIERLV